MADGVLIFATPLPLSLSGESGSLDRRCVAPSVSNRGGRPIPRRRTAGNATAGTERQDLQRLWRNPTDISKWSFLIRQRICREGQASFSRPHSRLATLSLTVKSDPQRPERARPATSRVARSESRAGRTSRKSEGGTREEGPNDDRS